MKPIVSYDVIKRSFNYNYSKEVKRHRVRSSKIQFIIVIMMAIFTETACKKFVQIEMPPDKITQTAIFSSNQSAIAALNGILGLVSRSGVDMAEFGGLLADEWILWSGVGIEYSSYYTNSLFSINSEKNTGKEVWNLYYNYIFRCNEVIENLADNDAITQVVKQQLLGEAHFLRAWFYFYLTNLYGDIPLSISTNPEINRLLPRSSVLAAYKLMEDDLLQAQDLLSENYVDGKLIAYATDAVHRVRPSKWAASALLARIYLYTGQWEKAVAESDRIITNTRLFSLSSLSQVFLKESHEAIWQTQPTDLGWNTRDARRFHLGAPPTGLSSTKRVRLSQFLVNTFEPEDQRRIWWVDSIVIGGTICYFPVKYKVAVQNSSVTNSSTLTEFCMALRVGEQYLIRAEAKARLNNLTSAVVDVDSIRGRAGLPLLSHTNPGISKDELLNLILHERQIELFSEWGHRWFDLKRFNKADEVMNIVTPIKGGTWETTDKLLPIPYNDLVRNPNIMQSTGY